MKKLLAVILAFLYISTSIGANVHMHYCMGQLADTDFNQAPSESCPNCSMDNADKNHKKCCTDEHKLIKNSTDQNTVGLTFLQEHPPVFILPVSFLEFSEGNIVSLTEKNPISNAPPRSSGKELILRNCVFLI